jgi:putative NADH-flavin reductase
METTEGMTLTLTRTACKAAASLGATAEEISETFASPKAVYPSRQREGQYRIAGRRLVLVGFPVGESRFHAVTVWENGTKAPVK